MRRRLVTPLVVAVLGGALAVTPAAAAGTTATPIATGFAKPTWVGAPPGDPRVFVLEQHTGRVRIIQSGRVLPTPALDLGRIISRGGEQGLLGLAFAPDFARTGHLFLAFTDRNGDSRVVRYTMRGDVIDPTSATRFLFLDQPYANHNGGDLLFGPDGRLWIGTGDGGSGGDPDDRAQNPRSPFGKMLRLDVSRPGSAPEVWALGLRNPWRYSYDAATGMIWIGDVGQSAYEEIDRIPASAAPGANFGWPLLEGDAPYKGGGTPARYVRPIVDYAHAGGSCSVTGGLVVRDRNLPRLYGRYVFADYCSGDTWSVAADAAPGARPIPLNDVFRGTVPGITSFGTDGQGRVLIAVHDGRILRLAAR